MNQSTGVTDLCTFSTNEYFQLKQIYDKKINNISILVKDTIFNDKVNFAYTLLNWSNEEKNNYINTYTYPDKDHALRLSDFETEVQLKKEMINNIYKEACSLTMNIIIKYCNIKTIDNEDYKTVYDNYKFF